MHAYLIISSNGQKIASQALEIINNSNSQKMEFDIQKIADVRELKDFLKINLPSKTAIVINNFSSATVDAQNALLKELEEPQEKLIYILTTSTLENILPTIVSRCELIEIFDSENVSQEIEREIKKFLNTEIGEKLQKISAIKDRGEAIEFMENIIKVGHKLLLTSAIDTEVLEEANKTLGYLKSNGNVQLQLTNFVINL